MILCMLGLVRIWHLMHMMVAYINQFLAGRKGHETDICVLSNQTTWHWALVCNICFCLLSVQAFAPFLPGAVRMRCRA